MLFKLGRRHSQAVALLVARRLAVHQQHVVVRAVAGNVVEHELPDFGCVVVRQGHGLPVGEGAGDFDRRGVGVARLGGLPAECLAEKSSTFRRGRAVGMRCARAVGMRGLMDHVCLRAFSCGRNLHRSARSATAVLG